MGTEFAEPEKRPVKKPEQASPQPLSIPQSSPAAPRDRPQTQAAQPKERVIPDPNRPGHYKFEERKREGGGRVVPDPNNPGGLIYQKGEPDTRPGRAVPNPNGGFTYERGEPDTRPGRAVPNPNGGFTYQRGEPDAKVATDSQPQQSKTASSEPMQLASAQLDAEQAQIQPRLGTPSGEMKVAGGQIRLDPGDSKEKPQRNQAEIERLYPEEKVKRQVREQSPQLVRQVQQQSLTLLENNKQRLNTEQQKYTSQNNPNSKEWQSLWGAAQQRQDLQAQGKDLESQLARMAGQRGKAFGLRQGSPEWHAQIQFIKEREAFLNNSIALNRQAQVNLQYAFPALVAVQDKDWQNRDLRAVQQRLPGEFNSIRGSIDGISGDLRRDASLGTMFDASVERYLAGVKDPKLKQGLHEWVEQQQLYRRLPAQLLGASSGALFLAAFFPPLATVAGGLRIAAGIGGVAAAGSEIPDLVRMDMAAQAGRGGVPGNGQLTSALPDEARLNLVGGWTNVVMAGIDVGLETKAIQALARGTSRLGASGVRLSRQQLASGLTAARQGGAQLKKYLAGIKDLPQATRNQMEKTLLAAVQRADDLTTVPVLNGDSTLAQSGPLSGVRDRMETRAAARASGATITAGSTPIRPKNIPEVVFAKYPKASNWDSVAPLINQQAKDLPPGYSYRTINKGKPNESQVIDRPRPKANERGKPNEAVPLQIAEDGTLQVGTKASKRISNPRLMKQNFEAAFGKVKDGYWIHHLIPDELVRNNAVAKFARKLGYDLDESTNLIGLAGKDKWKALQEGGAKPPSNGGYTDSVGHWSSHSKYSAKVSEHLDREFRTLEKKYGDLEKALVNSSTKKKLQQEVEQIMKNTENRFRDLIEKGGVQKKDGRISWNGQQENQPTA
jgi:hypothetical protein